jgi:hypothetical protein
VGFPIRKSTDQRVFAPPRSLSQRITSFIACACQGIHQLPLRHLIVLIANAHRAIPKGLSLQPLLCRVSLRAISKRLSPEQDPVQNLASMSLAQKDQLLEIGSRVRLGKPIICGRLSVSRDKSQHYCHEVRTNLLFTMSNRTSGELDAHHKPCYE